MKIRRLANCRVGIPTCFTALFLVAGSLGFPPVSVSDAKPPEKITPADASPKPRKGDSVVIRALVVEFDDANVLRSVAEDAGLDFSSLLRPETTSVLSSSAIKTLQESLLDLAENDDGVHVVSRPQFQSSIDQPVSVEVASDEAREMLLEVPDVAKADLPGLGIECKPMIALDGSLALEYKVSQRKLAPEPRSAGLPPAIHQRYVESVAHLRGGKGVIARLGKSPGLLVTFDVGMIFRPAMQRLPALQSQPLPSVASQWMKALSPHQLVSRTKSNSESNDNRRREGSDMLATRMKAIAAILQSLNQDHVANLSVDCERRDIKIEMEIERESPIAEVTKIVSAFGSHPEFQVETVQVQPIANKTRVQLTARWNAPPRTLPALKPNSIAPPPAQLPSVSPRPIPGVAAVPQPPAPIDGAIHPQPIAPQPLPSRSPRMRLPAVQRLQATPMQLQWTDGVPMPQAALPSPPALAAKPAKRQGSESKDSIEQLHQDIKALHADVKKLIELMQSEAESAD